MPDGGNYLVDYGREVITVVPKAWKPGGPQREFGQQRFFEYCYGANDSEWVAANCRSRALVEFRRRGFGPWQQAVFIGSHFYDGVVARVEVDGVGVSLFPNVGDEIRLAPTGVEVELQHPVPDLVEGL